MATNAAAALGAMPHPATGQRSLDLETGKFWLDVLAMLKEKTKGNLHPQEDRLLEGLLGDLRMQYVQLVRATEEKLKQDAAQKFSGGRYSREEIVWRVYRVWRVWRVVYFFELSELFELYKLHKL